MVSLKKSGLLSDIFDFSTFGKYGDQKIFYDGSNPNHDILFLGDFSK